MVEESVDVPVMRDTRSYFWLLSEVRVKVSSKRVASAMVAEVWKSCRVGWSSAAELDAEGE